MTNRDRIVNGLHAVLFELWEGSDEIASADFRKLLVWSSQSVKPFTPSYTVGTFPAPVSQQHTDIEFLQATLAELKRVESAWKTDGPKEAASKIQLLLAELSQKVAP
jgi:hypothetical protein